ncbi:efflux RND transporter permease subunit [Sulfurospirillum sp. 1612]|uniref:efflux RND transporter permease subunit n=1 Tax=Sulfurospirillum sp. 1612 TaxID=3094835 RepID=UPI002F93D119
MKKIIKFFLDNSRMNYTFFVLILALGVYSYTKIPKEIFPTFDLDKIMVRGSYSGTSINILDKIAVKDIEDAIKGIEGIDDMNSVIVPGSFSITLDLLKGYDKYNIANQIKDAISDISQNFPSDMNDPKVVVLNTSRSLLTLAVSSDKIPRAQLKKFVKDLRTKILNVKDISDVTIYGDSDMYYDVKVNEKKLDALGINKTTFFTALSNISYIYPIGKIEGTGQHFYISTYNGAKNAKEMEKSIIKVGNKTIYLSDVATVEKRYEDATTLATIDTRPSFNLAITQIDGGNALNATKNIEAMLKPIRAKNKEISFQITRDGSKIIRDRLNIVVSNILFSMILVTLLLAILINSKMAFIVGLGIPTSIIMAVVYFHFFGYTINMISLIGVLLALGILVDDAIVVAESIQQYVEKGYSTYEAALTGASDVAKPVIMASVTTLFSFIPVLMLSGTMGEFMKLIPIAVSALLVASLVESFIFLPLHASHILNAKSKVLSWDKLNKLYNYIIHKLMTFRKTFLFLFLIIVPVLTVLGIKQARFQMFPKFDSTLMTISMKADINTPIEETYKKVNAIARILNQNKKKFDIESITTVAGHRTNAEGGGETYPYVANINLELYKIKPTDFVNKFVTPYLSLYYDKSGRIRTQSSQEIAKEIRQFLKKEGFKKKLKLDELFVAERRAGPVKSDIKIGIISNKVKETRYAITQIKEALKKLKGIKSISDDAKSGIDEIKLKLNSYGEELGLSEKSLGSILSDFFLERKISTALDSTDLLEIKTQSIDKNNLQALKDMLIPLGDGRKVMLHQIVDFNIVKSFEKVNKNFGETTFYVYANVDPKILTASEAIEKIKPVLNTLQEKGIHLRLLGEQEKSAELKTDMLSATFVAILLILLSLLYLFNSFKDTFIIASVIPFSFLGVIIGHQIMGLNLSMPSIIGALGLAGVVINDGILMLTYLRKTKTLDEFFVESSKRLRPIFLTSITTLLGLSTLIFFPTGQAVIFQPLAVSLGFGLGWGTFLNLLYVPTLYAVLHKKRYEKELAQY